MRKLSVNTHSGMSRPPRPLLQAKRVAPPSVPDHAHHRHSSGSFGAPLSPQPDDKMAADEKPAGVIKTGPAPFTFPRTETLTHKAAVFYHQQLALQEDLGIDVTPSPGRDSPGSSSGSAGSGSRHSTHSTVSLDSGRASSYRSCGSCAGCARSDHDCVLEWLMEVAGADDCAAYAQLFTAAGYDLPTIARMTPEDLTAIGIAQPRHRERIKLHIDSLQLPDALPNYVPASIDEWLRLLRLEEYAAPLISQGFVTVRDVTQLTWEDLEDSGIVRLGHQKKILLAIKRVKDILSGKIQPVKMLEDPKSAQFYAQAPQPGQQHYQDVHITPYNTYLQPNLAQQQPFPHQYSPLVNLQNMQWRRSYDDGDLTPTNEMVDGSCEGGGGTLPRQRSTRPQRPVAKVIGSVATAAPPPTPILCAADALKHTQMIFPRRRPPEPPRRSSDTLEPPVPYCPLPQYQYYNQHIYNSYAGKTHHTQAEVHVDHCQRESSSSIDSIDALPFANENAGTIKQRLNSNRSHETPVQPAPAQQSPADTHHFEFEPQLAADIELQEMGETSASNVNVLNDIGHMLANLTDELDAMLQEEKMAGIH